RARGMWNKDRLFPPLLIYGWQIYQGAKDRVEPQDDWCLGSRESPIKIGIYHIVNRATSEEMMKIVKNSRVLCKTCGTPAVPARAASPNSCLSNGEWSNNDRQIRNEVVGARLTLGQARHAFEGEEHIKTTADLNGIRVRGTTCPSVSENVLGKPVREA